MESKAGIFVAYLEPETAGNWPCWKLIIVQKRLVFSPWYPQQIRMVVSSGLLGGGFKHFLFSPLLGEDSQFD